MEGQSPSLLEGCVTKIWFWLQLNPCMGFIIFVAILIPFGRNQCG